MRKQAALIAAMAIVLMIGAASVSSAGITKASTPIENILVYKSGLNLTDKQISKLEKFDAELNAEISEVQVQLDIRKTEVDKFMSDWSTVHGTATNHLIKEYYDLQAKLKQLELESIMKARGVLTIDQMKRYSQMMSVEAMMMKLDNEHASAY